MKFLALYFSLVLVMVSANGNKKFGESCTISNPCGPYGYSCNAVGPFEGDCLPGLLCDTVCKYDLHHACAVNLDCADRLCYNGKCAAAGMGGMPCQYTSQCMGGLICKENMCQNRTYHAIGDTCASSVECEFGCTEEKCAARAVGECTSDEFCSGQSKCIGGTCY